MTAQASYWTGIGAALAMVLVAGLADWRRTRRSALDDAGWVPWRGVQVVALFAGLGLTILAMHG